MLRCRRGKLGCCCRDSACGYQRRQLLCDRCNQRRPRLWSQPCKGRLLLLRRHASRRRLLQRLQPLLCHFGPPVGLSGSKYS